MAYNQWKWLSLAKNQRILLPVRHKLLFAIAATSFASTSFANSRVLEDSSLTTTDYLCSTTTDTSDLPKPCPPLSFTEEIQSGVSGSESQNIALSNFEESFKPFSFIGNVLSPILASPTLGLGAVLVGGAALTAGLSGGGKGSEGGTSIGGANNNLDDVPETDLPDTDIPFPDLPPTTPPVDPPVQDQLDPLYFSQSEEYQANGTAYNLIGLDEALANTSTISGAQSISSFASPQVGETAGHAGDGVTIAILDSGVDITHPSLDGNTIASCSGACSTHYGDEDVSGHGSHVAGIAAAEKDSYGMHGVAYKASILPGCANFAESCQPAQSPSTSDLLLWSANHGAQIANMSFGLPFLQNDPGTGQSVEVRSMVASDIVGENPDYSNPELKSPVYLMLGTSGTTDFNNAKAAFEQGLITVVAAGNHIYGSNNSVPETAQAGMQSIAPLIYQDTELAELLSKQWLTVVNVDNSLSLASSSHACGDTKNFCLAAPGTNIQSTTPDAQHGLKTGTSMATPMVSGAIALIMAAFPTLKLPTNDAQADICNRGSQGYNPFQCLSKAVVNRILATASDLGATGVDSTFGHGLLNLDAATRLVGTAQVATASGQHYDLNDSHLNLSPTMGHTLARTLASVNFIAVDSYDQAGFVYQGTSLLGASTAAETRVNTAEYLDRSLEPSSNTMTINGGKLTLTQQFQKTYTSEGDQKDSYRLSYASNEQDRIEVTTAFDDDADFAMHNAVELGLSDITISSAFNSPYSQFNEQAKGIKYQMALGNGYTFESGFFQSESVKGHEGQKTSLDTSSVIMQLNTPVYDGLNGRNFSASLQIGALEEDDSILGTNGSGAWDSSDGSESLITGINLDYQLNTNTHLLLSYFYASTDTDHGEGLLQNSYGFTSSSFSMGLLGELSESWQYGLFVTQPLRLASGIATLQLPSGFNGNSLAFSDYDIDLTPEGRHLEYELALSWKPKLLDYMRVNILRVEDYGNIPGNNDTMLLFSAGSEF